MRIAIALILLFAALPCVAQERVFHALSIDLEQNDRLDALEARLSELECQPDVVQAANHFPVPMKQPVKIAPSVRVKPYAVITIETLPGCPPCERWKSKEAKELRAQGWTVIETSLTSSSSAPFFRVCIGDKCYSHSGFMSHGALRAIVDSARGGSQQARAYQPVPSSRYTTTELRGMIHQARPGGWAGPIYADVSPRSMVWQHLVGPEHGFSSSQVNGLSQDEALILHDLAPRHGNQIFPQR